MSRFAVPKTASRTASTSRTQSTASDCSGNLVCTDGVTVTLDSSNGPAVGVCSLFIGGSAVQSPTGGCDNGTTKATGNAAVAVGRTNVNLADSNDIVEADTCGIALALDLANPSTASVVCGSAPGLGAVKVNQANILALLGPTYVALSNGGDLSADICGAAAALGMDDTKTNASVFCQTLSSAQNWQAGIPATTLSVGDDLLSADVQKTYVTVDETDGISVTVCAANVSLLGSSLVTLPETQVAIPGPPPTVNCSQDANLNPIVSTGQLNLAVGDTGAGGGLNEGGATGGTCGGGGGGTQGATGTSSNSCGTSNPPPGETAVPGPINGAFCNGNACAVLGQNNTNAGPGSSPGGGPGLTSNECGAAGSGDPSAAGSGVKCQNFSFVKSQVKGVTSPPKKPAKTVVAGVTKLAKTGFPLLSGLIGLILIAIGGIEIMRRREEQPA